MIAKMVHIVEKQERTLRTKTNSTRKKHKIKKKKLLMSKTKNKTIRRPTNTYCET